jgi:hypothetical protein
MRARTRSCLRADFIAICFSNAQYQAKKKADKVSYLWDRLIEQFTRHMLDGTSLVPKGFVFDLSKSEEAVRQMALVPRFLRRNYSQAVWDAMQRGRSTDTFFRAMLPAAEGDPRRLGFIFMTQKYLKWMDQKGGYEKYREMRSHTLTTYAKAVLIEHPYLECIVGIAMEPPGGKRGASEDLLLIYQQEWGAESIREVREDCDALGIMQGSLKKHELRTTEYPPVNLRPEPKSARSFSGNRKQRRSAAARARKRK